MVLTTCRHIVKLFYNIAQKAAATHPSPKTGCCFQKQIFCPFYRIFFPAKEDYNEISI